MSGGEIYRSYKTNLKAALDELDLSCVERLANEFFDCWTSGRRIFICGNGGSAGNASHIANDFVYPVSKTFGSGIKIQSLSSNESVITCLANDEGYENIYSYQLSVLGSRGDVLIVLSGSGNSKNIINAVMTAKDVGIKTYGIIGFDGGACLPLLDNPIHVNVNDMQICEDMQTIIAHMVMQSLFASTKDS